MKAQRGVHPCLARPYSLQALNLKSSSNHVDRTNDDRSSAMLIPRVSWVVKVSPLLRQAVSSATIGIYKMNFYAICRAGSRRRGRVRVHSLVPRLAVVRVVPGVGERASLTALGSGHGSAWPGHNS